MFESSSSSASAEHPVHSVRCFGETKFFRQCPRYIYSQCEGPSFCWEHRDQQQVRVDEQQHQLEQERQHQLENERQQLFHLETFHPRSPRHVPINFEDRNIDRNIGNSNPRENWAPLGAYLTNLPEIQNVLQKTVNDKRLNELAEDDQNVHTAEVQLGVSGAIKRLRQWAGQMRIQKNLPDIIAASIRGEPSTIEMEALSHLHHCYQWNDDTLMFGTTYPQLATWVWARINRGSENDELLRYRFFEEVQESKGQCLNGNMARLMNIFSAIDLEMSPQSTVLSKDELQRQISIAVRDLGKDSFVRIKQLLQEAHVPKEEHDIWLEAARENVEN